MVELSNYICLSSHILESRKMNTNNAKFANAIHCPRLAIYAITATPQQRQYTPGGASASSSSSTLSKLKTMAGYANYFVPPGASASHIHTASSNLARGRGGRGGGGRGQQRPYNR